MTKHFKWTNTNNLLLKQKEWQKNQQINGKLNEDINFGRQSTEKKIVENDDGERRINDIFSGGS
jgi:hypothetical protein